MGRLGAGDRACVRALRDQLDTFVDGGPSGCATFMPALLEAMGAGSGLSYSLRFTPRGPAVDVHFVNGLGLAPARTAQVLESSMRSGPDRFAPYDLLRPQADQRNRALVLGDLLARFDAAGPPSGYVLYRRFGIYDLDQLRALVCDGPSLLAWVGGWREEPFTERERGLLQALTPALRRRLLLERLLETDCAAGAALAAALEAIPRPAFVVSAGGSVRHANAAGLAVLARHPRDCREALRASLRRAPRASYEVFPVRAPGLARCYLAVRRRAPAAGAGPVAEVAHRWGLTPRQQAVLRLLVRGCPNQTIAALLGVAESTVEHHVSRLLARVGVDGRAALLARVMRAA